jgi:hypothetical protein
MKSPSFWGEYFRFTRACSLGGHTADVQRACIRYRIGYRGEQKPFYGGQGKIGPGGEMEIVSRSVQIALH